MSQRGYLTIPEVARQVIREQVEAVGKALPWADREAFARLLLTKSIAAYVDFGASNLPAFSDRGIPDAFCYSRLIGMDRETGFREACRLYRYANRVFLAPPWEQIYITDNERKQDFAEAARTYELMKEVYRELGYECIVLPKTSVSWRADFVLHCLGGK